jgi:hypothetical protein
MAHDAYDAEFALLLACARLELNAAQAALVADLLCGDLDWQRLYLLADKHGLRPFLFRHLGEGRHGRIPAEFEAKLWRHSEQLRRRNRQMEAEMLALVMLLRGAGIPALAHKGPVVAHRAYADPDLREYGDLDLLLPQDSMRQARVLLEDVGYLPKYALTPATEAAMLASSAQYHLMLAHREHGMLVELHWKSDNDYPVERSEAAGWWQSPCLQTIGCGEVPCLRGEEFLLALCLHGSKHYWASLHWLVDVAELMRKGEPQSWAAILERGRELGAERRLALPLVLAGTRLGLELPEAITKWASNCEGVEALASAIIAGWPRLDATPPSAVERMQMDLALCDRPVQRFRHLSRTVFLPGVQEWSRWPLPRPLHFLYVPLRLGGLLSKPIRRSRAGLR